MLRLIIYLLAIAALATGLAWLADRPGNLLINWEGYEIETSVFRAVVLLAILIGALAFAWSLLRQVIGSPAAVGQFFSRRRQKRGLEALSTGMIAIGAGDRSAATRYAIQARKSLPNEPLTHLLRAQAAQLSGDKATARRIFEAMLASPDTEQLGLRGLFLEAERVGDRTAARSFAERAVAINPKLGWCVDALFELQCKEADWSGALDTLSTARRHYHVDKATGDRRRAVLLTAKAQAAEESASETAQNLALEAHGLAPDLVPAAAIAGRILAARGHTARAAKVIQKTWAKSPHPDLATAYAYARIGDSPRDRYERVKQLAFVNPMSIESSIALAQAAIEARMFAEARAALEPLLDERLTPRAAILMARIEGEQNADKGRVREWMARAVTAARDPAWTADGVVSEHWAPVSPVTGALDAFQWRVPVSELEPRQSDLISRRIEELVALGAAAAPVEVPVEIEAKAATPQPPVETVVTAAPPPSAPATPAAKPVETVDAIVIEEQRPAEVATQPKPPSEAPPATVNAEPVTPPRTEAAAPAAATANGASKSARPAEQKPAARPASRGRDDDQPPPPAASPPKPADTAATKEQSVPSVAAARSTPPAVQPDAAAKSDPVRRPAAPARTAPASRRARPEPTRESKSEPRIFVSPRPPDDPGADLDESGDGNGPLRPYRVTN